jgi:hypothetical protein
VLTNEQAQMDQRIGIDIGNVLTKRDTDIRPFGEDYLNVQPCDGAFEAVTILAEIAGPSNIFIISKCSLENQKKSLEWLEYKNFFSLTGVRQEHVYFCLKRSDKRTIAENLQLNYFVDDRWTVLTHLLTLDSIRKMYLFCPVPEEKEAFMKGYTGEQIMFVESWEEIVDDLKSLINSYTDR